MLECGISKVCITPDKAVRMAGYADRTEAYTGQYEDIYLKAICLKDGNTRTVVLSADLIWWNPEIVEIIGQELSSIGWNSDEVILTATHSHSGPGTGNAFIPPLENGEEHYMKKLSDSVLEAIQESEKHIEPVTLRCGHAEVPLNVDRRVMKEGKVLMLPNYDAKPDRTMTVFSFCRADGSILAAMVHYPCHANLSHENMLQRDYPGILQDTVEKAFPGSMVIFLQGATGDMRPNSVLGDRFIPAKRDGVISFGREAGEYAISAIKTSTDCNGQLSISSGSVDIPVIHDFSVDIDDETRKLWMTWIDKKGQPDHEVLTAKRIRIGNSNIVFLNSEIVRSYAAFARELSENAVITGYSDGMIGYIPDDNQIMEGGYEPVGSAPYFAVAGKFSPGTEGKVKKLIKEVLK